MSNKKIHVLSQLPNLAQLTAESLPDCDVIEVTLRQYKGSFDVNLKIGEEELNDLKDAEIVFGDPFLLAQTLHKLSHVKWMQGIAAGIDWYINALVTTGRGPPQCQITRFSGQGFGQTMFDYCVGHMILAERKFFRDFENMKIKNIWNRELVFDFKSTNEMTVAILGATGAIGSYMAIKFKEMGCRVIGFGRSERDSASLPLDKYSTRLKDILPECDCLISVLPSTPLSNGLLNYGVLELCLQKSPIFINIGRGSLIAETEIVRALHNKWISTAIVDVFETEPLPSSSVLWSEPNVIITPHISAITRPKDCVKVFVENYQRFVSKQKLLYLIDWNSGY